MEAQWPGGLGAGFGIVRFQVQAPARNKKKKGKAKSTAAACAVTPPDYKPGFLCATQDHWARADKSS